MKYSDHQLLEEAYEKVVEQNLEEGFFDRVKSGVGGVKKTLRNAGDVGRYAKTVLQTDIGKKIS